MAAHTFSFAFVQALWPQHQSHSVETEGEHEWAMCFLTALVRNLAARSASWSNNWKQVNPAECFHDNSAR